MEHLTAEQAIDSITSIKTNIFGTEVQKYNYGNEIRCQLQKCSEGGLIKPSEYYRALKLIWESPCMLASIKYAEYEELNLN